MNIQILIVTIVASILFGFVALAISFNLQRKYELTYIKSYFYHQILIFLFGFYGLLGTLTTHYFLANVDFKGEIGGLLLAFLPFIGIPFMVAAWYMFIRISFEMIDKKIGLKFTLWFFVILIITFLVFGFLVPYIDYFVVDEIEINTHVFLFFVLIEILTLSIVFTNYFIFSNQLKDKRKLKFIKFFALVNLLLYLVSVVFLVLGENNLKFIAGYTILYFFKDIIPLLLVGRYLNKNYVHPQNIIKNNVKESFNEQYGISKRESEIVDEIVKGRTNKEISERLFISVQTVKDHIHNIYLKTGVKNRVQLTNLIRQNNLK